MKPFTRKGKQDFFCKDTYNRRKILFSMIQKTFSRSQKAENVIKSKILDTIKERTHVNILYLCGENANELHENLFSNCRLRLFFNRIMNKKLIFGIAMMLCCTNLSAQNTARNEYPRRPVSSNHDRPSWCVPTPCPTGTRSHRGHRWQEVSHEQERGRDMDGNDRPADERH